MNEQVSAKIFTRSEQQQLIKVYRSRRGCAKRLKKLMEESMHRRDRNTEIPGVSGCSRSMLKSKMESSCIRVYAEKFTSSTENNGSEPWYL